MRAGCFLLSLCLVAPLFADVQDSLFKKALDAESAGDVPRTVALLEEANSYRGRYNAEIREILQAYYDALQMENSEKTAKEKDRSVEFSARLEGSAVRYDEYGDTLGAHEYSGDSFLSLGADLGLVRGNYSHYLLFSFSSDVFFREENTVFDTSRWAFSPEFEYMLSGERFSLSASLGLVVSERDGTVFFTTISGERDLYYAKDYRAGILGYGYLNDNLRSNVKAGIYGEYRPKSGFWANVSLFARFDGDSSVTAYFTQIENSPDDGSGYYEADTVRERYYLGRNLKLGPEIRLLSGYRFNRVLSLAFSGYLFYSCNPETDRWKYFEDGEEGQARWIHENWNRQILQGSARLRAEAQGDVFGVYVSFGTYFRRYLFLPSRHPELYAYANILSDLRLGVNIRF